MNHSNLSYIDDNPSSNRRVDLLVIGGGPAGTTAATLLSQRGFSVVLLEKDEHPRFHIGESLLPMNLEIIERLGVLNAVEKIGVTKLGADFTYDAETMDYRTYRFDRALGNGAKHAYEVRRQDFDHVLFENCVAAGVETYQNEEVTSVKLADGREPHTVTSTDANGRQRTWLPGYVLDASGRSALLASRNKWKKKNPLHASAAIFGHFKGVTRRPGADSGNISLYWFASGWLWMIPLKDDVMSIGAVCWPEYLKSRQSDPEAFLRATLALNKAANTRLDNAELVSPVRVTGNYSYTANRLGGDGYLLLGDAYAFIDPVFSSGVYLAMNSAEQSVPIVEHWLNNRPVRHRLAKLKYERRTRKGLKNFSWFIYRFTSPAMRNLFHNPRNIFKVEQAVISMLAGDVFDNKNVQIRLFFFRCIYGISWLLTSKDSLKARRQRLQNPKDKFA